MDIDLNGGIDGIEAAKEIRSRYSIPIIFSTGHKDKETNEQAKIVEHAGYFVKPVDCDNLKLAIDNIILSKSSISVGCPCFHCTGTGEICECAEIAVRTGSHSGGHEHEDENEGR